MFSKAEGALMLVVQIAVVFRSLLNFPRANLYHILRQDILSDENAMVIEKIQLAHCPLSTMMDAFISQTLGDIAQKMFTQKYYLSNLEKYRTL